MDSFSIFSILIDKIKVKEIEEDYELDSKGKRDLFEEQLPLINTKVLYSTSNVEEDREMLQNLKNLHYLFVDDAKKSLIDFDDLYTYYFETKVQKMFLVFDPQRSDSTKGVKKRLFSQKKVRADRVVRILKYDSVGLVIETKSSFFLVYENVYNVWRRENFEKVLTAIVNWIRTCQEQAKVTVQGFRYLNSTSRKQEYCGEVYQKTVYFVVGTSWWPKTYHLKCDTP